MRRIALRAVLPVVVMLGGAQCRVHAQGSRVALGPGVGIHGGLSIVNQSEMYGMEWAVTLGGAVEYTLRERYGLGLDFDTFGIDNRGGRFRYVRLTLQPVLFLSGLSNPRTFVGLRVGHVWKTTRPTEAFYDSATAPGISLGLVVGARSHLSPIVAAEGVILGDLTKFGDVVADGLAIRDTSTSATSLTFRAGLVLVLRGRTSGREGR